jgi:hypothetical protein
MRRIDAARGDGTYMALADISGINNSRLSNAPFEQYFYKVSIPLTSSKQNL